MKTSLFYFISVFFVLGYQVEKTSEQYEIVEFKFDPESVFIDKKKNQLVSEQTQATKVELSDREFKTDKMHITKFKTVDLSLQKESDDKKVDISANLVAMIKRDFDNSGIKLINGNKHDFFYETYNVFISKDFSKRYFGDTDPFNKILILEDKYYVLVKGVYNTISTDLKYDIITNLHTFEKIGM